MPAVTRNQSKLAAQQFNARQFEQTNHKGENQPNYEQLVNEEVQKFKNAIHKFEETMSVYAENSFYIKEANSTSFMIENFAKITYPFAEKTYEPISIYSFKFERKFVNWNNVQKILQSSNPIDISNPINNHFEFYNSPSKYLYGTSYYVDIVRVDEDKFEFVFTDEIEGFDQTTHYAISSQNLKNILTQLLKTK